jgi:hypothetical protein
MPPNSSRTIVAGLAQRDTGARADNGPPGLASWRPAFTKICLSFDLHLDRLALLGLGQRDGQNAVPANRLDLGLIDKS